MPVDRPLPVRNLSGRDRELEVLSAALVDAAAGRPRVVVVEGEPGMGKTAVLDQFLGGLGAVTVLRLGCDAYEEDVPFGMAEIALGAPVPVDADLLTVGRRLLEWLTAIQGADGAVVLAFDDVQWMDRASVDALRFALRRLRADRVLTFLARRPPRESDPWAGLLGLDRAAVLHLGPMSAPDVVDLASRDRGWTLSARTAERLVERTGGLPLLVRAFLADGDREMLDDPASLPATVTESVRRLVQSLAPEPRRIMQALAVLDEPTGLVALSGVADVADPAEALAAAGGTVALSWGADRGVVGFSHDLFRRAVYDGTPLALRQELHRRAVPWSTGDRRLGHRVAASVGPDPELAADLVAAADSAEAQHRPLTAAVHLLQARTVTTDAPARDDLLLRAVLLRLGAFDITGAAALRPSLEQLPPSPFRSLVLGILAREQGDVDDARRLLTQTLEAASAAGDRVRGGRAVEELASLALLRQQGLEALAVLDRGRAEFPADDGGSRLAMMRGIALWQEGRGAEALAELSSPAPTVELLSSAGMVRFYEGDLPGAQRDLDGAIRMSGSRSSFEMLDRAYVQRCLAHYSLGDWDLSAVDAHTARTFAEDAEHPWTAASAYAVSALVPASRGQTDLARDYLAKARVAHEQIPSVQAGALLLRASILDATLAERWEQVAGMLESVRRGPMFERLVSIGSYPWIMVSFAQALVHVGRLDQAEQEREEYARLLARRPVSEPARMGLVRAELALARGDDVEARAGFAADLADPGLAIYPYRRAETLYLAGRTERAVRNRRRALELLGEARGILAELRAEPALARVDEELAAAGVSASRGDTLDLTPREQDVASLVARGHTNAEVAAELFLTAKTIEYHLGNIYAKLGISGRRQLRERMLVHD